MPLGRTTRTAAASGAFGSVAVDWVGSDVYLGFSAGSKTTRWQVAKAQIAFTAYGEGAHKPSDDVREGGGPDDGTMRRNSATW